MIKSIIIYEPEQDTIDWLTDPDTDTLPAGALDDYESRVISDMKKAFPDFDVEIRDRGSRMFVVTGVDWETEYDMINNILPYVHDDILNDMGNDWSSWYPS